jgi:hypothetical protein
MRWQDRHQLFTGACSGRRRNWQQDSSRRVAVPSDKVSILGGGHGSPKVSGMFSTPAYQPLLKLRQHPHGDLPSTPVLLEMLTV